ncbi:AAA family ATPase [Heliophilum fasciatum]|uniref:Putative ATPase n=1 Tax=Heliophilum fasciatum TaxID=35700 RepID=A0A4R2S8Z1_9FIRM|nr:DUF3696 domain-containing protein [Heliophilum fasciatum]MCW2276738.1 putative ATPase [Heliophilum fasciatum]TCP68881.1 putative ATPase [Heliophilum fasciatum]
MLTSLRLLHFKCFADQTWKLAPLTLLCGRNGMGKSSVIQSLLLLRQSAMKKMLEVQGLLLNGDLVALGAGQDVLYQWATIEEIGMNLETEEGHQARWRFGYEPDGDVLPVQTVNDDLRIYRQSLFGDHCHYLMAERMGPRTSFDISNTQVRKHRQIGTQGEYAAHYLAAFGEEPIVNQKLAHPAAVSLQLIDQLNAWLAMVSAGARINVSEHQELDLVSLRYRFAEGGDLTQPFRACNVGFGLSYTLPVLLVLLITGPDGLLLLENPEAHLHPSGQFQMGQLLAMAAACGVQVIVETHSDHVLNGIRLAVRRRVLAPEQTAIHYFEKHQMTHQVLSPRIDRQGRLDVWPDGFFDQWEKSLDALLDLPSEGGPHGTVFQ